MILRIDRLQTELPPPSDPDPIGASAVQELLGGKYGEMSTFMNYTYQSFNFRNRQGARPFYDLVASIAAEEFGHIELVSAAINTMLTGATEGKPGELGDLSAVKDVRNTQHFIAGGAGTLVQDSNAKPWSGDYVFASGDLIEDLTHNFFLETGARNNKLKVYEMVDHPAARALTGYLLVRGGVHQVAYARALEKLTGADLMKLFPSPRIPTDKIPECQPHIKRGEHLKLYRFSPERLPGDQGRVQRPAPRDRRGAHRSPKRSHPRVRRRSTCPPKPRCSHPDRILRCSPRYRPSCARPPACPRSPPEWSPTTATARTAKASSTRSRTPSAKRQAPLVAPRGGGRYQRVTSRPSHPELGDAMAELTHLDEKLAEVLGLAQAAQAATKKVATLARQENDAELRELLERMGDEAAKVEQRCDAAASSRDGVKTAIAEKARETKAEVNEFMKTYLEDAEALDGLEFLSMAEAGELAHWEILAKLNETANDSEIARIVKFALPLQQAHVDAVREQSLRLAGDEDPTEPA